MFSEAVGDAAHTGTDGRAEISCTALSAESAASVRAAVLVGAVGLTGSTAESCFTAGGSEGAVSAGPSASIISALFSTALRDASGDHAFALGRAFEITAAESTESSASIISAFLEGAVRGAVGAFASASTADGPGVVKESGGLISSILVVGASSSDADQDQEEREKTEE